MYVDISTSVYVKEHLHQFSHKTPIKPQHQPYPDPEWTYSVDAQKMKPLNTSPALPTEGVKIIEHIIETFLYYARGVDNMCLFPLGTMAKNNDPTEQYEKNVHQFLDNIATNPNSMVIFHASYIILCAETNSVYLT